MPNRKARMRSPTAVKMQIRRVKLRLRISEKTSLNSHLTAMKSKIKTINLLMRAAKLTMLTLNPSNTIKRVKRSKRQH